MGRSVELRSWVGYEGDEVKVANTQKKKMKLLMRDHSSREAMSIRTGGEIHEKRCRIRPKLWQTILAV